MHYFQEQCQTMFRATVFSYFLQNNVLLDELFLNTRNNQGLGKCYQRQPLARLVTPDFDYFSYHKMLFNRCSI